MHATPSTASPDDTTPGLRLLLRLRWLALAGQVGLCVLSQWVLGMILPWSVLLPCMAVTGVTNALAILLQPQSMAWRRFLCAALLLLDTVTLTIMLYWTGGSHNPFAIFYLLHIGIATILLPYVLAWAFVLLCGLGYALLFNSSHIIPSLSGHEFCGSMDFHLHGMLLALILVGMGIVYFIGQLRIMLARREAELQEVHRRNVRNERFASLATLAAGVAHELATPLGTIALVSEDLAQQAGGSCKSTGCMKDAALIRSEVERCRVVMEKLRMQTTDGIGDPYLEMKMGDMPKMLIPYLKPENLKRLTFEDNSHACEIRLPQTALLQSLSILIKNACQASGPAERVHLNVHADASSTHFIVTDRGQGMTPETLERAGEPFFTTKEPGEGMGLGLFLVRMFTERINGELQITSTPGKGTKAELILPRHHSSSDENSTH